MSTLSAEYFWDPWVLSNMSKKCQDWTSTVYYVPILCFWIDPQIKSFGIYNFIIKYLNLSSDENQFQIFEHLVRRFYTTNFELWEANKSQSTMNESKEQMRVVGIYKNLFECHSWFMVSLHLTSKKMIPLHNHIY